MNKIQISDWLKKLQDTICNDLEIADDGSKFEEEIWERKEGGGGRSRIFKDGKYIEKGGVLFSAVDGIAPEFLFTEKEHSNNVSSKYFFATGLSIVIHPKNPMTPIIHMNIRYFEMDGGARWLGGGIDLTPHYIVKEDAVFFHQALKNVCDKHHPKYYNQFKKWADDYFFIPHRNETRGIGGVFFDRLNENEEMSFNQNLAFWKELGETFSPTYLTLIQKTKNKTYTELNKQWQLLRRGRYVEFNLIYDKGTKFGLETNGRVESILMSLPKFASWEYNFKTNPNSDEAKTTSLLKKEINWI